MVKITNNGNKPRHFRGSSGFTTLWLPGETLDIDDKGLLRLVNRHKDMGEPNEIGKEVGSGGLKTHVRPPKRGGRLDKSRKHVGKSKQATKEKVKPKSKGKPKKPKGLRKSKRAD
jgi:hypothetical protein